LKGLTVKELSNKPNALIFDRAQQTDIEPNMSKEKPQ
jgi:hypothetical protein